MCRPTVIGNVWRQGPLNIYWRNHGNFSTTEHVVSLERRVRLLFDLIRSGEYIMQGPSAVIAFVLSAAISGPAFADFLAIGPITSSSCSNYILFGSCKTVTVDAVEADGKLYEPRRHFQEVTSYDEEKNKCSVRVSRPTGLSITGAVAKALTAPTFLTKTASGLEKIENIEYMSFKCRRTN